MPPARTTVIVLVHGALQVGLASAMLGMHLPCQSALLTLVNAQFPAPLRFPARVRVRGEIIAWNPATLAGRLRVTVFEAASGVATADIGLGFSLHEELSSRQRQQVAVSKVEEPSDRPTVLVTGASRGIGLDAVRGLLENYRVVALHHRNPLPKDLEAHANLRSVQLTFSDPGWPGTVAAVLGAEALYGVVHFAWPGVPRGGLLRLPSETFELQLAYGTTHLIDLAKLLASHAGPDGGRLMALGSIFGSHNPSVTVHG